MSFMSFFLVDMSVYRRFQKISFLILSFSKSLRPIDLRFTSYLYTSYECGRSSVSLLKFLKWSGLI